MQYAIRPSQQTAEAKPPVLVVMHGYGADEYDLLPLASHLPDTFLVLSLQAPTELLWGGYSWYDLMQTADGFRGDDSSRHESIALLKKDLPQLIEKHSGDTNNVYLLGFSQGAAMAYSLIAEETLASVGVTIRGVAALSGYIPQDEIELLKSRNLSDIPFFISHGELDELISPDSMKQAVHILSESNANVESNLYPVGHGIDQAAVEDLSKWLHNICK